MNTILFRPQKGWQQQPQQPPQQLSQLPLVSRSGLKARGAAGAARHCCCCSFNLLFILFEFCSHSICYSMLMTFFSNIVHTGVVHPANAFILQMHSSCNAFILQMHSRIIVHSLCMSLLGLLGLELLLEEFTLHCASLQDEEAEPSCVG